MTIYIGKQRVFRDVINRLQQRRIVRSAIDRSYTAFERNHQQWTHLLIDTHFIMQIIAPWLTASQTTDKVLTPFVFAASLAAHLSTQPGQQQMLLVKCLPVAVEFLRLLQKELSAEPTILTILVLNRIDREMVANPSIQALPQAGQYV